MNPWRLSGETKSLGKILRFENSEPFTACGLRIVPKAPNWAIANRMSNAVMVEGKLYAVDEKGVRTLVAEIQAVGSNPTTDFLPLGPVTYSLKDTTAKVFEFEGTPTAGVAELTLTSEPLVAKVVAPLGNSEPHRQTRCQRRSHLRIAAGRLDDPLLRDGDDRQTELPRAARGHGPRVRQDEQGAHPFSFPRDVRRVA
jgi:hypothetical protein